MRVLILSLSAIALTACSAPSPQRPADIRQASAPFVVPMDPGLIPCAAVSNPAAMAEAVNWTMGRARAAAMAGTAQMAVDPATLEAALSGYCAANPSANLAAATRAIGL